MSRVSVPDTFGALILKTAAHRADSRDPARHLQDAAVLLACIEDPYARLEREHLEATAGVCSTSRVWRA